MHLLDGELRLLTPAAGSDTEGVDGKRYQLTHDYLVQPIREWLARAQRETRRGRAELRLAERAAAWEARPEGRSLPFAWEWLSILLFTRRGNWSPVQRRMMRQAAWRYVTRGLMTLVTLLLLGWGGWEIWGRLEERARRSRMLHPALTPEAREYLRDLDFSELVANMPGTFYLKDLNGVYIYANDNWVWSDKKKGMVMLRGTDVIGKSDVDLPWKDDAELFRQQDREVLESGEPRKFESVNLDAAGERALFITLKAPLRDRHGRVIGIIGYSVPKPQQPEGKPTP
jgi:PAS domain-containing protein